MVTTGDTIYVAHATTESCDHYLFAFTKRPTREMIIKKIWKMERAEELSWYENTTSVKIEECELE